MIAAAYRYCLARSHQAPSPSAVGRLVRSARRRFEDALLARLTAGLPPATVAAMEATLAGTGPGPNFAALKADPDQAALESLLRFANRLAFLRGLGLSRDALAGVAALVIERLRRRVARGRAAGRCAAIRRHGGSGCSSFVCCHARRHRPVVSPTCSSRRCTRSACAWSGARSRT